MAEKVGKIHLSKEEREEAKAYIKKIVNKDKQTIYLLAAIDSILTTGDSIISRFSSSKKALLSASIYTSAGTSLSGLATEVIHTYLGRKIKQSTDLELHSDFDKRSRAERKSMNPEETNRYADTLSRSAASYAFQNARMVKAIVKAAVGIGLTSIAIASSGITAAPLIAAGVAIGASGSSIVPYFLNKRLTTHKVDLKDEIDNAQKDVDAYSRQMYPNSNMIEAVNAQEFARDGLKKRQNKALQSIKKFAKKILKYNIAQSLYSIAVGSATIAAATALGLSLPATVMVTAGVIATSSAVNQIGASYFGKKEYIDTFAMTYRKFKTKFKDFVFGNEKVKSNANVISLENIAYKHRIKSGPDTGKREEKELFTSSGIIRFEPGITILSGASGAGKSTLTELLLHADNVTSGQIRIGTVDKNNNFEGQNYTDLAPCAPMDNIAISFQRPELIECTIDEYIRLGNPNADEEKVKKIKALLGIGNGENGTIDETKTLSSGISLSGGEQTRIGLAQALIKDSPIMILDEPTSGVDEKMSDKIVNHLKSLQGKTIIYITHDPDEIEKIGAYQAVDIGKHSVEDKTSTIKTYDLTDEQTRKEYIKFFSDRVISEETQSVKLEPTPIKISKEMTTARDRLHRLASRKMFQDGISQQDLEAAKRIRGKSPEQAKIEAQKVFDIINKDRESKAK